MGRFFIFVVTNLKALRHGPPTPSAIRPFVGLRSIVESQFFFNYMYMYLLEFEHAHTGLLGRLLCYIGLLMVQHRDEATECAGGGGGGGSSRRVQRTASIRSWLEYS